MKFKIKVNMGDFAPSSQSMTDKGLLCRDAVLAIGDQIREYTPAEINATDFKGRVVRMLTPAETLFSDSVMANLENGDFVEDHPIGNKVTTKNWRLHSIGSCSNVRRDGDKLVGDLLIRDEKAIKAVRSKKKVELSLGYEMLAEMRAGMTDDGKEYDAVVTSMIGDHVALVKMGRGGRSVRIGDSLNEDKRMKIKLANGMTFEVEGENLEAFVQGLEAQNGEYQALKDKQVGEITIGDQTFKLDDTVAIQAAFDTIAKQKVDAETKAADLEANAIKPADVEKLAAERASTLEDAKNLKPDLESSGKSLDEIISEAVTAHESEESVKAVLEGVAVGDSMPDKLKTAFKVLVATKASVKQIKTQAGDSATAQALKNLNTPAITNPMDLVNQAKSNMYKGGQ